MVAVSYRVSTQAFSGPFDLLLHLVGRQKVAIGSISIAEVADQYLDEVEHMKEIDLDVASDFVLVASTLLDIKAASLIPEHGIRPSSDDLEDEDGFADLTPEEAREVLIARLIAYKQFRNVSASLAARMEAEARMVPRSIGPDPAFLNLMPDFLAGISLRSLAVICADLDSRRESLLLEAEHIAPRRIPVVLTVVSTDRQLRERGRMSFTELLDGQNDPEAVVVTFLAVLELFKRGLVNVRQSEVFGEIDIEHVEGAEAFRIEDGDFDYESNGE